MLLIQWTYGGNEGSGLTEATKAIARGRFALRVCVEPDRRCVSGMQQKHTSQVLGSGARQTSHTPLTDVLLLLWACSVMKVQTYACETHISLVVCTSAPIAVCRLSQIDMSQAHR